MCNIVRRPFRLEPLSHAPVSPNHGFIKSSTKMVKNKEELSGLGTPRVRQLFQEFVSSTTIYGIKYLDTNRQIPLMERIMWLTVTIIGIAMAVNFQNIMLSLGGTITTVIASSAERIHNAEFPAVTICNNNILKRRRHREQSKEETDVLNYIEHMMILKSHSKTPNVRRKNWARQQMFKIKRTLGNDEFKRLMALHKRYNILRKMVGNRTGERLIIKEDHIFGYNLIKGSHNCDDMVLSCKWRGNYIPCSLKHSTKQIKGVRLGLWAPVMTDFGKCCHLKYVNLEVASYFISQESQDLETLINNTGIKNSFQYDLGNLHKKLNQTLDKPPIGAGAGLEILLDAELYQYGYSMSGSEGFKVVIHQTNEQPIIKTLGFEVPPGAHTVAGATFSMTYTSPEALNSFPSNVRMCYSVEEEATAEYGHPYSAGRCHFWKSLHHAFNKCGCMPFPLVSAGIGIATCRGPENVSCISDSIHKFSSSSSKQTNKMFNCLPTCNETKYKLEISSTKFPNEKLLWKMPFIQEVCLKLLSTCKQSGNQFPHCMGNSTINNVIQCNIRYIKDNKAVFKELYKYSRNLAFLTIYIKHPHGILYKREATFSRRELFGSIGGIASALTGMSLIGISEIAYFVIIRPSYLLWKMVSMARKNSRKPDPE